MYIAVVMRLGRCLRRGKHDYEPERRYSKACVESLTYLRDTEYPSEDVQPDC
jgi:hypothetical protein